jgi:hypothetical protein
MGMPRDDSQTLQFTDMKLDTEFIQLPLTFDAHQLAEEVAAFEEHHWRKHPGNYQGNSALVLISSRGEQNDGFVGPMLPTPLLARCPYIQQVLASFDTVFGRSRLMRLAPGSSVPPHIDGQHHWYNRVRIHVPIITHPDIRFICNSKDVNMAPGEAWIFNSWQYHTVINKSHVTRVHLVADTTGSPAFWKLAAAGHRPFDSEYQGTISPRYVPFKSGTSTPIITERYTHPPVMSPGEVDGLIDDLLLDLAGSDKNNPEDVRTLHHVFDEFRHGWRTTWTSLGPTRAGWPHFQKQIDATRAALAGLPKLFLGSNGVAIAGVFEQRVLSAALIPELMSLYE